MKRSLKKIAGIFAAASVCAAMMIGCGKKETAATTEAETATETTAETEKAEETTAAEETSAEKKETTEKLKIRLGSMSTNAHIFTLLAKEYGILDEEGIEIEQVFVNSYADACSALNAGKVDVLSNYGTAAPLANIASGQDWTIFGGYMIIGAQPTYSRPGTEFTGLESFVGKKIGTMVNAECQVLLKGMLYKAGIDPEEDVTFVEYDKHLSAMQACKNGEIDFCATGTGFNVIAEEMGLELTMYLDEYWPNYSCCRMFSTTEFVNNNEEALSRLLKAFLRVEELLQEEETKDTAVDLVVKALDQTKETAESYVKNEHLVLSVDPYKNAVLERWDGLFEMHFNGLDESVKENVNIEDHINTDIYYNALKELSEKYADDEFYQERLAAYEVNDL